MKIAQHNQSYRFGVLSLCQALGFTCISSLCPDTIGPRTQVVVVLVLLFLLFLKSLESTFPLP